MLEAEFEERLEALEQKVEELSGQIAARKPEPEVESVLIPGAEYDFVPSVEEKVIFRGVARIVRFEKAPDDLGLSPREWELLSSEEDA